MAKAYTGIDIGAGHLKLAVCDATGATQVVVEDMPDNLMRDGHVTSYEAMAELLKNAVRKHKIGAKDCALVLHSQDVFMRRIAMPAMTVDELKLNLPFEFKDFIADGKDKYRFDYAVLETRTDATGKPVEMDILAVAVQNETIEAYASMLRRAGLKLKIAAPDVVAYMNIVSHAAKLPPAPASQAALVANADAAQDFCFLNIGSTNTKVYLFPGGKYEVMRVIDLGVASLVSAVADYFSVDANMAKTYLANNYEDAQLIQPCLDLYERLSIEVARIVSFFNFNFPESQLQALHYCGSGSYVDPLIDSVQEHLSVDVLDIGAIMPASSTHTDNLRMCPAAVGIALQ